MKLGLLTFSENAKFKVDSSYTCDLLCRRRRSAGRCLLFQPVTIKKRTHKTTCGQKVYYPGKWKARENVGSMWLYNMYRTGVESKQNSVDSGEKRGTNIIPPHGRNWPLSFRSGRGVSLCTLWLNAGMRDFLVLICGREGVRGMPCFGENVEFNMFGKHKKR